ncbi:MAG: four helix bundle protein [Proteobacteria bacterium]|nr:four helix bundle protein [Pseudomonadota bacterium]
MNSVELKNRTKDFALRIAKLVDALPKTLNGRAIGSQLIRSGTSVAANYRAALRARSQSEFISKIGTVVEEADETVFWLEFIIDSGLLKKSRIELLKKEAEELLSIFCATQISSKNRKSEIGNRK